jgi:hypothetical protein
VTPAEMVPPDSIIVIQLAEPAEGGIFDFTFVAATLLMFIQLQDSPQPLRGLFEWCNRPTTGNWGYGQIPNDPQFIVAKRDLETAVRETRGLDTSVRGIPEKRQCVRPLGEDGELVDDTGNRIKGTFTFVIDLDGVRHVTRNKADVSLRERELAFVWRAMDPKKREYGVTTDVTLQTEVYRRMLCEQADTQPEDRKPTFMSCGLISRVQRLQFFFKTEKLKLLLMGCVMLEGSAEPTLTLDDFVTSQQSLPISMKSSPCSTNNVGLIAALKNFQLVMQIIFSESFGESLGVFIQHLEGARRPMELVPADLLKYTIELTLRRVFRTIRVDLGASMEGFSVKTPELCAQYLTTAFEKVASDLSDHQSMTKQNAMFRLHLGRVSENVTAAAKAEPVAHKAVKPAVSFTVAKDERVVESVAPKVCSGHFGKQISAVRKDGRPYTCGFEKGCTFVHMSIAGKSQEELIEVASQMPAAIKRDLLRAIYARKK